MEVSQYTFVSPYPSAVQVGRPDTSSSQKSSQNADASLLQATNETAAKAQNFAASQTKEVTPTLATLDTYV